MRIKKVRRFSKRVYKGVLNLLPQLVPEAKLPSEIEFRELLKCSSSSLFIAELDNNVIAGMLTVCTCKIPSGIKFLVEDVVVDNTYRGKGIGRELTLHAIELARSKGARSVDLTSRPSRKEANHLYQSLGFELRETNVYRYSIIK